MYFELLVGVEDFLLFIISMYIVHLVFFNTQYINKYKIYDCQSIVSDNILRVLDVIID